MNLKHASKFSLGEINELPDTGGVFWIEAGGEVLFARMAESIRRTAMKFIEEKRDVLSRYSAEKIEVSCAAPPDLLEFYADFLRQKRPRFDFVLAQESNLPFLILTTSERFPRILATRRPENARARGDSVYGAFVPRTGVRFLLDFVQRIFKLHPCELDVKGDFDAPCPEYFLGHCLAPCVAEICDDAAYAEAVELAHLLLTGQSENLLEKIDTKIRILADELDFEKAAEWRDARGVIDQVVQSEKWKLHVAEMTDVLTVEEDETAIAVYAATLKRGRGKVQNRFEWQKNDFFVKKNELILTFIAQYYRYFAPKQIFISFDFPERKFLEKLLAEKFGRRVKIIAESAAKLPPTVQTAQKFSAANFMYRRPSNFKSAALAEEIQEMFKLPSAPRRIECFDVAHLAGEHIIAGRVVAVDGELVREEETVWEFKNLSEIEALAAAVGERLRLIPDENNLPDLIVLDGARAHLNAVEKILQKFNLAHLGIVAVVKPPGDHAGVRYFLSNLSPSKISFSARLSAARFLQKIRDAAHDLANSTHRQTRTLAGIFENRSDAAPQIQYLRVPIRFAERFGAADDIIPIRSLSQAGKILLKSKGEKNKA